MTKTNDSKFDIETSMQNYDFNTLYAEYKYDANSRTNKIMRRLGENVSLPTFEQTIEMYSRRKFSPEKRKEALETVFQSLPVCDSYLFDEACFAGVPDFAKSEFVDIYMKFRRDAYKKHRRIDEYANTFDRAGDILAQRVNDLTDYEKEKMEYMKNIMRNPQLYAKIQQEALKDFLFRFGPEEFFESHIIERIAVKRIILFTFILYHFELPEVMEAFADLRAKIREILDMDPDEYVGF